MGEEGLRISIMARRFENENPGVKVITQAIPWDAAHEKLLTSVVGGLPPDVCQLGTTWMAEFATLKALEPLEGYIENSQAVKPGRFFEGSWNTVVVGEKIYGIPWYVDTRVLYYRKDLLKEAGFSHPPETWDELKQVCRNLIHTKDGKIDRYGISLPVRGWQELSSFVWQNNGDVLRPTSKEFKEALAFYVSFFSENLVPSHRAADVDLFHAFKTGFYPMFISGPWMVELLHKELPELDGRWAVAMMPGKKKRTSFVGGCNLVLFRDSREKDLGWKFIEFMSRPEIQYEWYQTVKGLPAILETWQYPIFRENPTLKVLGEQLKDSRSPPAVPEWEQIAELIETRVEAIVLGDRILDHNPSTLASLESEIQKITSRSKKPKTIFGRFFVILLILFTTIAAVFVVYSEKMRRQRTDQRKSIRLENSWRWILARSIPGYLFITPALIILALFLFVPILISFFISLTDWNIYGMADHAMVTFVGLENYTNVFKDAIFWKSLLNTLIFAGVAVPFTMIISLICATVLNEKFVRFKTFFRTAYFIPVVSTIVAVAVIWRWIYNPEYGLFNWVMHLLSLPPLNWLADPHIALASLILMAAWKNFGYNMIIFLAGLQSIPDSLYESARIDGANGWQLFLYVTLPGLRTTTVFVGIMSTIGYLQFFAEPYVMTKGGPLNSTMSIVLYMYNQGFKFFELGYASALAYVLFGIIFIFTFIQIRLRKSGIGEA